MRFNGFIPMDLVNWPGKVAATVFTAGCNLRCPYCHNADLVEHRTTEEWSEDGIISFLLDRKGIQGLVISGGEPTLQKDLVPFIRKVKQQTGLPVKLDTNGTSPETIATLLSEGLVDYIAMDIKAPWNRYAEVGGAAFTERVKESLNMLRGNNDVLTELRTTCTKGMLAKQDIIDIIRIADGMMLTLQPFDPHQTLDPLWRKAAPWTKEELERIAAPFPNVSVR